IAPSLWSGAGITVSGKALLGMDNNQGDRVVLSNSGSQDVTANYNGYTALAGLDGQYRYPLANSTSAIFSAGADVAAERFESYSESQYFTWSSRMLTQGSAHAGAGLQHTACNGKLTLDGEIGVAGRDLMGGKRADYAINGTPVSFMGGDNSDLFLTARAGGRYQLGTNASAYADVSGAQSHNGVKEIASTVGLRFGF
ncbi:MAG: autotransporter outer membrane beta-barrel domain-containing protein, partial [Pseudomonadota bacterium]|nr:autotransporter outer membrane beta-barrel domain-containing protein [Pseudomonadota bacterium]